MATTNRDRIGKGMDLLKEGLAPFVEQELKAVHADQWQKQVEDTFTNDSNLKNKDGSFAWDVARLLSVMWNLWDSVFRTTLGRQERSLVSELRQTRNFWAHQGGFSTDDAYRAFDSMHRLLQSVSAPEAREIDKIRQELLRGKFDEQARHEKRKQATLPTQGQIQTGLKPWREVVTPHPDVASGNYRNAEFAADLAQVARGDAVSEYQDPREFFRRTFITQGLEDLLKTAALRLTGKGGDPVVDLQTNFGGGKTHSLLALYHLFSGKEPGDLLGVETYLKQWEVKEIPQASRVVIVGHDIPPGQTRTKPDGTKIKTLWGELAWQLGNSRKEGAKAYAKVAESDANGTSPGKEILEELFNEYAPCLILIDEWVAYARQLYKKYDLPAGSFETQFTFAQALSEAAKSTPKTLLVLSVPASQIEVGGDGGEEAMERLKNILARTETSWRPASTEEGFEIVRRRLFEPILDSQKYVERDTVLKTFSTMYREQQQEFPQGCGEGAYLERMKNAYPIHPELFDRMYEDWSALEKFQRTRGVLRLMAAVIHDLWKNEDRNLLIMPGNLSIAAPRVSDELTRYLEDNWRPIIERDVDGPNSRPLKLDGSNHNLGRYSACRRVARSIYLGSAPLAATGHPGVEEIQIKLGCVQPGESVPIFGDALRRLTDEATHLYVDGKRYWFSIQPSVTRLAQDRATQQETHDVGEEVIKRLRNRRDRGDFVGVHTVPESSSDVPDSMEARLVILEPEAHHVGRSGDSPALEKTKDILSNRGNSPRIYRNTLVFLAPDKTRLKDLEVAARQFLAWQSIVRDQEDLELGTFQRNQAKSKLQQSDDAVKSRILETYCWTLVPDQPDPQGKVEWQEVRLQGQEDMAMKASKKLKNDELLLTQFSATRLRMELDKWQLWKDADHISLKKLWEYFCSYLYLSRLRDESVLMAAIQDGISQTTWGENFAYAEGWDESKQRYQGLKAGTGGMVFLDENSVLVKPEAAQKQLELEKIETGEPAGEGSGTGEGGTTVGPTPGGAVVPPQDSKSRRFHGNVNLDPIRVTRDVGKIAEEVIQHLSSLTNSKVDITLEIQADVPDGVPENIERTVTENCRTLRFKNFGFEKE